MEREPSASEAAPAAAALFAWGANSYGQLGLGHKEDVLLPQQLNDFFKPECIRRITGGGGHSAVVTDGGGLFVCGLNKDGQLGLGHTEDVLYFTACPSLLGCPIQQVACGWDFTIILTAPEREGCLHCCWTEACFSCYSKWYRVPVGDWFGIIWTAVVPWADSPTVFDGKGTKQSDSCNPGCPLLAGCEAPCFLSGLENSKATCVLAGSDHSASLTDAGELYVWGSNKHGLLASLAAFLPMPQKIEAHCFQNEKVTSVWSGWTHLVAQTETGKVFTWGRADYGQLGRKLESREDWKLQSQDPSHPCSGPPKNMPSFLPCLTGAAEFCEIGAVFQFLPMKNLRFLEKRLGFSKVMELVSCGSEHNLAVIGGTCYSWGWNEHGMCGDGSEADIRAPKPVQALRSSLGLLVGCGAGHSLALCQLPALPELVTGSSLDAPEDAQDQEAMDKERSRKERQPDTSTQTQSGRSRNGGLGTEAL
ncbi:secretion-regulating guanine nucleotide exchange factor isoform X2 [Callorhinus ursinus]|uniref:secretion-regulating guanine nucleotide exchange factor isoform X2 n=1 Tax=Callorhinus ursinus TaxID=34884 RepID=UPI003CCFF767